MGQRQGRADGDRDRLLQQKKLRDWCLEASCKSVAATYSPTWWGSTIGASELNFSVRNGKRWILTAITATIYVLRKNNLICNTFESFAVALCTFLAYFLSFPLRCLSVSQSHHRKSLTEEDVGLLVPLGFDITAFTPVAYQRGSLPRPSKDDSS